MLEDLNLYELLRFYVRNLRTIAAVVWVFFVMGLVYSTNIQKPLYRSTSTLILAKESTSDGTKNESLINNFSELMRSRSVLEPAIEKLQLTTTYEELSKNVAATSTKNTEIIKLSVVSDNAEQSQDIAEEIITSFQAKVKALYGTDKLQVLDTASTPKLPFNVNKKLQIGVFSLSGFVATITLLFFIFDYRSTRKPAATPTSKAGLEKKTPMLATQQKKTKKTKTKKKA